MRICFLMLTVTAISIDKESNLGFMTNRDTVTLFDNWFGHNMLFIEIGLSGKLGGSHCGDLT